MRSGGGSGDADGLSPLDAGDTTVIGSDFARTRDFVAAVRFFDFDVVAARLAVALFALVLFELVRLLPMEPVKSDPVQPDRRVPFFALRDVDFFPVLLGRVPVDVCASIESSIEKPRPLLTIVRERLVARLATRA